VQDAASSFPAASLACGRREKRPERRILSSGARLFRWANGETMRVQLVCCDVCSRFTLTLGRTPNGVVIRCLHCGAIYDADFNLSNDPRTATSEVHSQ